ARDVVFYHTDNVGTPVAMTNSTGAVIWRAHDKPFGEEFQTTETPEHNSRRFIGKEKDKETGLVYIGARYLDPETGRFLQPDPVGPVDPMTGKVNVEMLNNPQRLNRYAYGLNNPYRYIDPDGKMTRDIENGINPFEMTEGWAPRGGGGISSGRLATREPPASKGGTFERVVSNTELKTTQQTGLLRGGREGENFFTNSASLDAKRAQQRLGLDGPLRDARIQFSIKNDVEVAGPRTAAPGQTGTAGGGREFSTSGRTEIKIHRVDRLRK
ncbi:MAG: RHS repeat-associated core domain-containing protein, partial [Pseudomonadota bacterium]